MMSRIYLKIWNSKPNGFSAFIQNIAVMAKKHFKKKSFAIILLLTFFLGTIFVIKTNYTLSKLPLNNDREGLLKHVNLLINSGGKKVSPEGQACRIPITDIYAPEIMRLLKRGPKVVCNGKDWVEVFGSTIKIAEWAKKKYGEIQCSFTDIIRETDHKQHSGLITKTQTEFNLETSDVVQVYCISEKGLDWQKVLTGIRSDQSIFDRASWSKVPEDSLKLNVLMFGFDSVSHNMWKRKLPKSYKYATMEMEGIALNGYNIVGDGTPQALIPILTGKTELELPETRKRMGRRARYVNVYPFIWNDFQKNGYVTAWSEDMAHVGTFTYRLKGFKEQPVDHYMRTFYMEAASHFKKENNFCYGGQSRYEIMLDFVKNIYEVYKDQPKFIFAFHSEYSHENNNMLSNADEGLYEMLRDFHYKGYLNNTLLILMSDHGSRFSSIRNSQQGKQEERLPAFIFIFPSWFKKLYTEAFTNFKKNSERLTTPFDIHETLKDVLHFRGGGQGSLRNRGISLFDEIPLSRTCQDANIEVHWCACLDWEPISTTDPVAVAAVSHLLGFLNSYTSEHRNICSELKLGKILRVSKMIPNQYLLKFKKNADEDGVVGDMSDNTKISVEIYQVKVIFEPGNMIFESSVNYHTIEKKFVVTENEISRINKYRHMTHCLEDGDILHHLRKFCYCVSTNQT